LYIGIEKALFIRFFIFCVYLRLYARSITIYIINLINKKIKNYAVFGQNKALL